MKLSDFVFDVLARAQVEHVFYLPGGGAMHLVDSLGTCPGIIPVSTLHEQAASIAAEAYARVTNNLGVALVTTGPGSTNALTGVAGAWIESTPSLFLSGQVKCADLKGDSGVRQMGVQEVDIVSMVRPITKFAKTVTDPQDIRCVLEEAIHLAKTGRPGPVWVDIPLDVQGAQIRVDELRPYIPTDAAPAATDADLANAVDQAVKMLSQARRPVVLAGNGIRLAGAVEPFRKLADTLGIPVLTTRTNGVDLMPGDHPLYFGRPGTLASRGANFTLQNADLLMVIGARLDPVQTGYDHQNFAPAARKIMVDIDPAEIGKMKTAIDLPVIADAGAFVRQMLSHTPICPSADRQPWVDIAADWKHRYPVVLAEHRQPAPVVSTFYFSETLSSLAADDDLVVMCSSGAAIEIFLLAYQAKPNQRVFLTGGLGAMGFGLPAAVGACMAGGKRRTICVDADGGLMLNIQELATIAKLQLPITIFVLNNQGYASIRTTQRNYFEGRLVGSDDQSGLPTPDISALAQAFGLKTVRIENQNDLARDVHQVLQISGPVLCEINSDPDEVRMPCMKSRVDPDGSIHSCPLEDLWPFLDRDEFQMNMRHRDNMPGQMLGQDSCASTSQSK